MLVYIFGGIILREVIFIDSFIVINDLSVIICVYEKIVYYMYFIFILIILN